MADFRLSHFSARWKQEFEQAKSMLLWATEGWITEIVHIGATALDGSIASPTIDMLAGISSLAALNQTADLIEGLQYQRVPAPSWTDQELVALLIRFKDGHPSHTVLLANSAGDLFRSCIAHQKRLETDFLAREELANLKKDHLSGSSSLEQFLDAKSEFFRKLAANG